jgi:hybrid cluster-associated redox disulfide protein
MKIEKEMKIGQLVNTYPESIDVLMSFGMGCVGCPSAQAETIEEACFVHGFKVEDLLKTLNEKVGD